MTVGGRIQHAWNAFLNKDPTYMNSNLGAVSTYRPDKVRSFVTNERSIIAAIYNRLAMDVAANAINHVRIDANGKFVDIIESPLNSALSMSANIDQTGQALIHDIAFSMFDEGCIAVVPTETSMDPTRTNAYDIYSFRVGTIVSWYPKHIRVNVYDERDGMHHEITLPKDMVAIIENPFYAVMNEPNSTLKRLISKLQMLDAIDAQSSSGKLDLIIQLPYVIKTEARRVQAESRRKDIETQLSGSKYGIAYTDGTERVTQLNRPAENNLMKQIEYLTSMLYSQLGLTTSILDGTANADTMLNYHNRTIDLAISAITGEMSRKFLTKTARTQKQAIRALRNNLKFIPISQLAEVADKFSRNAILTPNEVRAVIGYSPSQDPTADKLENKNLKPQNEGNSVVEEDNNDITKGV